MAEVGRNFVKDGCLYRASSLAFTSLLGLVPMMAVGIFLLSFFPPIQFIGVKIQNFIFNNLVASSGETLQKYVALFSQQVIHMSWVGVVALFVVVAMLMVSIENALNAIWKLPKRPGRYALLRAIGRQWAMLIFVPLALGVSLILSSYLASLKILQYTVADIHLPNIFLFVLPAVLVFLAFLAIYKFLPATHVPVRNAAVGALVSTVLFEVSKELFGAYIYFFPTYKILYGAFVAIPFFLIWDYIVWLIVLFSAEITWLLGERKSNFSRHKDESVS